MGSGARIARLTDAQLPVWVELRNELWPDSAAGEHAREAELLGRSTDYLTLIASDGETAVGFAEAALRRDYVNGCDSSPALPVVFLEGIYVRPAHRRRGIARALCERVESWGRAHGAIEFASDALVDNVSSHAMHRSLGFEESARVVYFRKPLRSEEET